MILVTGGSEGIGLSCAHALLARTAHPVLVTGRSREKLDRARDGVDAAVRDRLATSPFDQARREDVAALVARIATEPAIEGAILAVGTNPMYVEGPRRLHALDPATIEATIRTNCTHTMLLSRALLDRFHAQRRGVLVWIGSRAAAAGLPGAAIYCATKSFLSGLARAAHHEYAAHGVRVHVVHPGVVRTPRTARVADSFAARHGLRVSEPHEAARDIVDLFLAGDAGTVELSLP